MGGLASIAVFALGSVFGVPAAVSSPDYQAQQSGGMQLVRAVATTTTTNTTIPTTVPAVLAATPAAPAAAPPPPAAPSPVPAPPPPAPSLSPAPAVPSFGHATAWGCAAALAYLQTYAAPGFALDCPGYAEGHEAMTCLYDTPQFPDACPNGPTIAISDPCPEAYMNESANSWYMTGQLSTEQQKFGESFASIDPFGACP